MLWVRGREGVDRGGREGRNLKKQGRGGGRNAGDQGMTSGLPSRIQVL